MPKGGPEVLDGLRKPGDFPDRAEAGSAAAAKGSKALPPVPPAREAAAVLPTGLRRYESDIKSLRLTVSKPKIMQVDGEVVEVEGKHAQFRDGFFQTDDAEIIRKLDNHSGMGNDYWDVDARRAQKEDAAEKLWLETARANPALLEKLKVMVGQDGFDLGGEKTPTP
jgi:hypothetical protein